MSSLRSFSLYFEVSLQKYLVHDLEGDNECEFVTIPAQGHSFQ